MELDLSAVTMFLLILQQQSILQASPQPQVPLVSGTLKLGAAPDQAQMIFDQGLDTADLSLGYLGWRK